MSLNTLPRHLRLVIRGETLAIQARLGFAMRRALVAALALLFAGLGIVFLNIGVYAALSPLWGPIWTPAGLGLINVALAAAALLAAAFMKPGAEVALAEEIRNMAGEQLEADLRAMPLAGAIGGGFDRALGGLLLPALTSIIGGLMRKRGNG